MTKLKLASIDDNKPVKLTVTLPAELHRNLAAYADLLAKETGKTVEPVKLIAPMLEKFIASDRAFSKARRGDMPPRERTDAARETAKAHSSTEQADVSTGKFPFNIG
jgi:hypothetical protein